MTAPSSPSPSSGSDDFAALVDADLQNASEELELGLGLGLGEDSREQDNSTEEDYLDLEEDGGEETEEIQDSGVASPAHVDEEEEEEAADGMGETEDRDDETEESKQPNTITASYSMKDALARKQDDIPLDESGRTKRRRMEEHVAVEEQIGLTSDGQSATSRDWCPPHPGFMWGVCIRCGENKQLSNSEPEPAAVSLRYIHEGLEVTATEAARMREDELKHAISKQKLYLVLDLDHTMLNSARFIEVPPEEEAYLAASYFRGSPSGEEEAGFVNGLYRLNKLQMWTKIRPFAKEFIDAASKICEMYVYTMGERAYAVAMVRLLDPTGRYFGERIISQGDSTRSTTKDLDVVLGAESAVVILDDTEGVWPNHRANLILMERYHFFRSSCAQFRLKSSSLTDKRKDESEEEGTLATALKTLRAVHHAVFNTTMPVERGILKRNADHQDVRKIIQTLKGRILKGCRVVFSRIFPIGMACPEDHPFWQLTAELGAHCSNTSNSATTHIIALDRGTDKARWAKQHGKFLVHPCWVEAAQYLWCRPGEEEFPVGENKIEPPLTSFAKTVDVTVQYRPQTTTNGAIDVSPSELPRGDGSRGNDVGNVIKSPSKD